MKKQSAFLLAVFLCLVAMSTLAFTSEDASSKLQVPADAIGEPNQNGPPTIFVNKLVTDFQAGGTITTFNIVNLNGDWKLLRKGTLNGVKRTEVVPIALVSGFFRFNGPVWYVVCDISAQNCSSPGFCNPNIYNTACVCSNGGANCNFGNSGVQLFDTEVLR
ncbi:MAG TPA: hypothetical protein VHS96_10850 [Bacteroidia bacterium]|nr:hypothetical protein [Bacteroidia bacterium]